MLIRSRKREKKATTEQTANKATYKDSVWMRQNEARNWSIESYHGNRIRATREEECHEPIGKERRVERDTDAYIKRTYNNRKIEEEDTKSREQEM